MTIMSAKSRVVVENEDSDEIVSVKSDNSLEEDKLNLSSDREGDSSAGEGGDDESTIANAGWADSIAKILKTNKPKGKKALVLSRAKKLTDVNKNKPKPAGFEVATADGEIKEELLTETSQDCKDLLLTLEPPHKKRKELPSFRVKPDILQKDRERLLAKIATKGVVQLFNAVKTQQKDIKNKLHDAGPLEVKKDKVLKNIDKRAFLDVLMGEQAKSENIDKHLSKKEEINKDKTTWSVLRDDFMMGAKLKDWDKELEEENESEKEQIVESESE